MSSKQRTWAGCAVALLASAWLAACSSGTPAGDGGSSGDGGPMCMLNCGAPRPGCRFEGPTSCSPMSCGTLVCDDAGEGGDASAPADVGAAE